MKSGDFFEEAQSSEHELARAADWPGLSDQAKRLSGAALLLLLEVSAGLSSQEIPETETRTDPVFFKKMREPVDGQVPPREDPQKKRGPPAQNLLPDAQRKYPRDFLEESP